MQPVKPVGEMSSAAPSHAREQWEAAKHQSDQSAKDHAFAQVAEQIEAAGSLDEIEAATAALRAWVKQYPEEKDRMAAVFSQLFLLEEGAREAEREADKMGLSAEERQQRRNLVRLRRRVRGTDPTEVFCLALHEARRALEAWRAMHPEDPEIPHLAAHLDLEEEMAALLHEAL